MNPAAIKMKEKIDTVDFKKPDYEIIANVTSLPTSNPDDIKKLLIQQIYSKVRWRESILFMSKKKLTIL